jgi:hypothetical protein
MKHLKVVFGLAVLAGLMAVMASSAMALGPRWVTCLPAKEVGKGHFNDSGCLESDKTNEWETTEVTETLETTSSSTGLKLEDSEAPGGAVEIECSGTNTGTISANGQDSVKTVHTNPGCKFIKAGACEEKAGVTAEARNLGWSTELMEINSEERDLLRSLVSGKKPGWNVTCTVGGILQITDECTANVTTVIRNLRGSGKIEAEFEAKGETSEFDGEVAECTASKKKSGHVKGSITFDAHLKSGVLRAFWVLAEALHT